MKLFEEHLLDASSDCTDFHLDFLERVEADLQKNPSEGVRSAQKIKKS